MTPRKYLSSEIANMKTQGQTEWGFIFYKDDTFRQSYDPNDCTVVVEKFFEGEWRCYETYEPPAARKVLNVKNTKRIYNPRRSST